MLQAEYLLPLLQHASDVDFNLINVGQVTAHLKEMIVGDEAEGKKKINVVSIVGGLADVKQERMLARKPEVRIQRL